MVSKKSFIFLLLSIFFLSFVSASATWGNPNSSIDKVYGPSGNITGWVNVSFNQEPQDSLFTDNRNHAINLSSLLSKNAAFSYTCAPSDCRSAYAGTNAQTAKTVHLEANTEVTYGIRLTGNVSTIDSVKFEMDSTALAAQVNQISIDFLDDGIEDMRNTKSLNSESSAGDKNYGCFNETGQFEEYLIGGTPYCQTIRLPVAPGFFVGAWIKNYSGYREIEMSIRTDSEQVGSCKLSSQASEGEKSCEINYSSLSAKDHYVCLYSVGGSGNFRTRGNLNPESPCGYAGSSPDPKTSAFQIYTRSKGFDAVGTLKLNKSLNGENFAIMADNYLSEKNPSRDCSAGCIIPVKITSKVAQDITLRNLEVIYEKNGLTVSENNFYDTSKTSAKISAGFQKLYLDLAGFTVPSQVGNHTFQLLFSGKTLTQKIEVKNVPIIRTVTPVVVAAVTSTEFMAGVTATGSNISTYHWDFGDGTQAVTSSTNRTSHVYSTVGVYNLVLSVTDQKQLSASKTFSINVTSPKNAINSTISNIELDIKNVEREISLLSLFNQRAINSTINLTATKAALNTIKSSYLNATTDAEYVAIASQLTSLNVPKAVYQSRNGDGLSLLPNENYANVDVIQNIAGGTMQEDGDYTGAVSSWNFENLDVSLTFNEFSGRFASETRPLVTVVKLGIREKSFIDYDYYLIIPEMDGFQSDSQFSSRDGYKYINLKDKDSVTFSTTETVDFTDLPVVISPSISKLTVTETTEPEAGEGKKWLIFGLIVFFLFAIGIAVYIIMYQWYKKRYEDHLFPNKNDLHNMIHYVHNAKKRGMHNDAIEHHLKKAGWSSEKVSYVMKKYAGKRTGMVELPLGKLPDKVGHGGFHKK